MSARKIVDSDSGPNSWRHKAACREAPDPEAWWPIKPEDARHARVVCGECPVLMQCAKWAAEVGVNDGVWAGYLLPDERGKLRKFAGIVRNCERCGGPVGGQRLFICHACTAAERANLAPKNADVRNQIDWLCDQGWSLTSIATASGVRLSSVSRIATGRTQASVESAEAIMALTHERMAEIHESVSA